MALWPNFSVIILELIIAALSFFQRSTGECGFREAT